MRKTYDVITIGAGISGLVSSCYLAQGGIKVLVIDEQNKPGGYCSSFYRNGFRFDAGPHYIGSVKRGILKIVLKELGLQKDIAFKQFDPTDQLIMPDTMTHIRANPYDTLKDLQRTFPKEAGNLDTFFKLLLKEDFISVICRIKKMTFDELLNIFFKDYRLRSIFLLLLGVGVSATPSRVSAISAILFYKQFILDPGYYPKGGMQQVPNALGQQLQANKGEILSNKRVVRILITSGKANGVMLNDGTKIYSKLVISNADATQTFTKLLATHPTPEARRLRKMRSSSSAVILFLGVTLKLTHHLKNQSCIWISDTYDIDAQFTKINNIYKKHRLPEYTLCYFPGLHDPQLRLNRNSIQIFTNAPYTSKSFWETNKHIYEDLLYKKILKILPALQQKNIVTKFGATPHTFSRYTNNNHGALYGWESNAARINSASMPQECSIPNLILTGHWCTSGFGNVGGIPGVAGLGRNAARIAYSKLVKKWPWSYFIIK